MSPAILHVWISDRCQNIHPSPSILNYNYVSVLNVKMKKCDYYVNMMIVNDIEMNMSYFIHCCEKNNQFLIV